MTGSLHHEMAYLRE